MKPAALAALCAFFAALPAGAQSELERETEIFGGAETDAELEADAESARDQEVFEAPAEGDPSLEDRRDDALFGEGETVGEDVGLSLDALEDRLAKDLDERQDPLALGGALFLRLEYANVANSAAEDQRVASPNLLDLYLDGRPTPRLRAYVRGRVRHDFTRSDEASEDPFNLRTTGFGTLDPSAGQTSVLLDQLWLKFDLLRTVFVTVGRQRIRWGTGRFWNPTDFLNRQFRDPLAIFDERLGVGLVKLHLPLEDLGWNLYAIGNFEGASTIEDVGGALRAEALFDVTEVSLTAAGRTGRPMQLGFDLSSALWLFDLRAEVAMLYDDPGPFLRPPRAGESAPIDAAAGPVAAVLGAEIPDAFRAVPVDRSDEWIVQASAGAEIQIAYSAQDSLFLGAEYFFFNVGQRDSSIYPALFAANAFVPLYTGRHYGALFAALPNPGDWNRSTFSVSTLGNLSDRSFLSRVDFSTDLLTFATFNAYASVNWGEVGEFRYSYRLDPLDYDGPVPDLPPEQAAFADLFLNGFVINAPRFNVGVAIRMAL